MRGKQKLNPKGIYYQSQSGIYQTVWLQKVPKKHITDFRITPDLDDSSVTFMVNCSYGGKVRAVIKYKNMTEECEFSVKQKYTHKLGKVYPWDTENPFLYDVDFYYEQDKVSSYFALRKCSIGYDSKERSRFFLNNKPLY